MVGWNKSHSSPLCSVGPFWESIHVPIQHHHLTDLIPRKKSVHFRFDFVIKDQIIGGQIIMSPASFLLASSIQRYIRA